MRKPYKAAHKHECQDIVENGIVVGKQCKCGTFNSWKTSTSAPTPSETPETKGGEAMSVVVKCPFCERLFLMMRPLFLGERDRTACPACRAEATSNMKQMSDKITLIPQNEKP